MPGPLPPQCGRSSTVAVQKDAINLRALTYPQIQNPAKAKPTKSVISLRAFTSL